MIKTGRDAARLILARLDSPRSSFDEAAGAVLSGDGLPAREKAFARDLVLETLRHRAALDWALKGFLKQPLAKQTPALRALLRLGACQILKLSGRVPVYAAISETVELAKRENPKAASFVNGVLRSLDRGKDSIAPPEAKDVAAFLSVTKSHPQWLVKRWLARWPRRDVELLLDKNNTPAPFSVRMNSLKAPMAAFNFEAAPSLSESREFREGLFSVQDAASQKVAPSLGPKPGQTIIDACAGWGGKAHHLAELMQNRGRVIACDTNRKKLAALELESKRLGILIVETRAADARNLGKDFPQAADGVLVDAPCSSLGVIRRHPDVKWAKREPDVASRFPKMQNDILSGAAGAVKPGGVLVYSVCSFEPEENEAIVEEFLKRHPEFKIDGTVRKFLPRIDDTDGFFIARFLRA